MSEVFLKIVNMSICAGWLVLAVLALRLVLRKAPRWVYVLLWGIVAVRLICPFSIESALSLIPSTETISPEIMMDRTPEISTGIASLDRVVNPVISTSFAPEPIASANPLQIWIPVAANLWLLGVLVMLAYTGISYLALRRKLRMAVIVRDHIFRCETVQSPFVLGILKPKIYLPYTIVGQDLAHVVAHEQAHIARKDHWWKPLGFALLTVHWFNPLMWAAYILLCRDIELACDEKVIAQLGNVQRADYTQALVACSVKRFHVAACPLAFGEVGVKERVKSIMNYRKPAFWVIVTAVVLCAVVAVCFLTDPNPSREFAMDGKNVADLDPWKIVETIADLEGLEDGYALNINPMNFNLQLTGDFEWDDSQAIRFFYTKDRQEYSAQLRIFPEEDTFYVTATETRLEETLIFRFYHYLQALKYLPQEAIRAMCSDADGYIITQRAGGSPDDYDRVITYTADGTQAIDGWLIHFELQPMHDNGDGLHGMGEEVIHLFYRDSGAEVDYGLDEWFVFGVPEVFDYPQNLETENPAFRGVTFRCNGYEMKAEDAMGETVLFSGMPIWNACFTDVTGDGLPDICATVSFGSGMIDTHVVVYDYANRQEYTLWDRGIYDYSLRVENGVLLCEQYAYPSGTPLERTGFLCAGTLILTDAGGGTGKRLVMVTDPEKPVIMEPTQTNLRGLVAGYLFVPIDGLTYRYALTEPDPAAVTADKFLDSCTEETPLESIAWEVYSLKEYPDMTKLLIISGTHSAWLCEYAPARQAEEGALEAVKAEGYVVEEDGMLTSGQEALEAFYQATQEGTPAFLQLAYYFTLDPDRTASATYEAYKQDYPALYIHELSYDGEIFVLRTEEDVRVYEYLMKYTVSGTPLAGSGEHALIDRYVLTHDNTHTWDQLWNSLFSSAMGVAIEHHTVCSVSN